MVNKGKQEATSQLDTDMWLVIQEVTEVPEQEMFEKGQTLKVLFKAFKDHHDRLAPRVKSAESNISIVRSVFTVLKQCNFNWNDLREYVVKGMKDKLTDTQRKRIGALLNTSKSFRLPAVDKEEIEFIKDQMSRKNNLSRPKINERVYTKDKRTLVDTCVRFNFCDVGVLYEKLVTMQSVGTYEEYMSVTLEVASLFLFTFPLRAGSVEVIKIKHLLNPIEMGCIFKFSKSASRDGKAEEWAKQIGKGKAFSKSNNAMVVVYDHFDPKNNRTYMRAYPYFVHQIVLLYLKKVRGFMGHSPRFNYLFALKRNERMINITKDSEKYFKEKHQLEKGIKALKAGLKSDDVYHILHMYFFMGSNKMRTFYETCKRVSKGDLKVNEESSADKIQEEHDKTTIDKHYNATPEIFHALKDLHWYLNGWFMLAKKRNIDLRRWDPLLKPLMNWFNDGLVIV
jgi:hypothetical protein